jgi:hypothetical protein
MTPTQDGDESIGPGTVLVDTETVLPKPFRLASDHRGRGWTQVVDNAHASQLEMSLASAGWTLFYRAGTIRAKAFGSRSESTIHTAIRRLFRAAKLQNYNSLEIDDIAAHFFWGVPYVSISAHSRRIQEGMVFSANRSQG